MASPRNTMLKVPYFAKGTKESLDIALGAGGLFETLDRAAFVFLTDTLQWVMIDTAHNVYTLQGYSEEIAKKFVQRGTELPEVANALTDVLYVVDNVVYTFDGTEFHKTFEELETVVNQLSSDLDATKLLIGDLPTDKTIIEYVDEALDTAKTYSDTNLQTAKDYSDANLGVAKLYTDEVMELHIVEEH